MAESARIVGCCAVVCVLAVVSRLGAAADAVATGAVIALLGAGVLACLAGYAVHVRRIRADIAAREARGEGLLRRVDPPVTPRRPAVCLRPQRRRRADTAGGARPRRRH